MGKIYVTGIGPGDERYMTKRAEQALEESDVIVGYKTYIDLIRHRYPEKQLIEGHMQKEIDRCLLCLELALEGKTVALICSGDPGVYGMASPMLEIADQAGFKDVEIIPGVTAALSGAALLGAPLGTDFCVISLSDRLTDPELIEKRLIHAAEADLCIVIYNPSSHLRKGYLSKACKQLLTVLRPDTVCGYVRNIAREDQSLKICTLSELSELEADMFMTVFIGNRFTKKTDGYMITPRGYKI